LGSITHNDAELELSAGYWVSGDERSRCCIRRSEALNNDLTIRLDGSLHRSWVHKHLNALNLADCVVDYLTLNVPLSGQELCETISELDGVVTRGAVLGYRGDAHALSRRYGARSSNVDFTEDGYRVLLVRVLELSKISICHGILFA